MYACARVSEESCVLYVGVCVQVSRQTDEGGGAGETHTHCAMVMLFKSANRD